MKKIAAGTLIMLLMGTSIVAAEHLVEPELKKLAPVETIKQMKPGLEYNGSIDAKIFNLANRNFGESSVWYFYPTYRMVLANVFSQKKFGLFVDIEKPGYANVTYPILKVNELYAKFQEASFYVKIGRQVFGDKEDLLLGFQNDAISLGFDLGSIDLLFFLAKTQLLLPWAAATNGTMDGLIGFVPTFDLGSAMALRGYLLVGTEPVTVTTLTQVEDKTNALILVGGKYKMDMPVGATANLGLGAQLGVQFGMARDLGDQSIDAMGLGTKIDGEYSMQSQDFGFTIGGHIVYTSGDPDPAVNTKTGFVSTNALVGAGPGLFSKIENGAGPYTFLDGHLASGKIRNYAGLFAFGVTADFDIGKFHPGAGLWIYSNTDDEGEALGPEFNEWVIFRLSENVAFYQQAAIYMPSRDGIGWPPSPALAPESAIKLLVGSSITF